jgi:molecular chaperone DnaK
VQAKDKATGKEQQIRIQASGGLSEAEIQRMVKEAEANADADKKRREFVEAKNHADALIHQTEKNLKEHEALISAQDRGEAESAIAATRSAMEGSDTAALKHATERLGQVAMRIGETMHKAAQAESADAAAASGASGAAGSGAGGEKVVDAEFEEVDENKKKSA